MLACWSIGVVPARTHPFLKIVGARVRERREALGWSQERLAAEAGQFAEFRAFAISIGINVEAHALAVRAALAPDALRKEAPWV
jgi:hypothetical protein